MKYIIDNKVYDTEKSELIGHHCINGTLISLYRSPKGTFWGICTSLITGTEIAKIIEDEQMKLILANDYERYIKFFGEVEEG